jgi:hypothetical protein
LQLAAGMHLFIEDLVQSSGQLQQPQITPGFASNSLLPTSALSPLLMMMHFSFPYAPISLVCELVEFVVSLGGGMSS